MKNQLSCLTAGMLMVAMLSVSSVAGATGTVYPELVVNGGFETGDLTGWTQSGDTSYSGIATWVSHTGSFSYTAGPYPSAGLLSPIFSITPGLSYNISFWLSNDNMGGDPLGEFTASFGGATLLDLTNQPDFNWTNYSFTLVATGSSAALTFGFSNYPGLWYLDDISVVDPPCTGGPGCDNNGFAPVPEPSTWLLFGSGLAGLVAWRYRARKPATA